jgi:hypothetical protein
VLVDVFTRRESTEFLGKRVPRGLSEQDADRLAEQLGDLPLAIEQAGAMLAETGMLVDEYLRLLNEHVASIMSGGKAPDYPMSMTAAWKLSVATLQGQLRQARSCCGAVRSSARSRFHGTCSGKGPSPRARRWRA